MKVVIFFGHHKVGSTALQAFLARNALPLMRSGILYPSVEAEGLAHTLARALTPETEPVLSAMNVREPHNALAFRMLTQAAGGKPPPWHGPLPAYAQMVRALRQQVRFLKPHTVILCSEVMSNFGAHHPELIDDLRAIFPEADYELYCVLRRPDAYLVSWHAQRLRFGDKLDALSAGAAKRYFASIHFDYKKLLAPWVERFPEARFHIRNYADVLAAGGSTEDFTALCGSDFPAGLAAAERTNTSLPRAAMEIARRGNCDLSADDARDLRNFLFDPENGLRPIANSEIEMFGAALRADMAGRFAPIHDYLSKLTGRPAFFPDIAEVARPAPLPEAAAVAQLLAQIDRTRLPQEPLRAYIDTLRRDYAA